MPAGRPTKQTKQIVAQIAEAISFGLTNDEAADAGIDDITFVRWNWERFSQVNKDRPHTGCFSP
jgi:hypothetical protein